MEQPTFTQQELALVVQAFEATKISPLHPDSDAIGRMAKNVVGKMQQMMEASSSAIQPQQEAQNNHVEAGL